MKLGDVCEEICFGLLCLDSHFQFRDLDGVVCRQRKSGHGGHKRSDVPLATVLFLNMRQTGEQVVKELENFVRIVFVQFESALQSGNCIIGHIEIPIV